VTRTTAGSSYWPLFAIPTLIWGSTFYAITFQLGTVPAPVSVVYRFVLAAALMFGWCVLRRIPLAVRPREHAWFAAQGACSFGLSYVMVYLAEERVTSGLVAMVYALMVFLNPAVARVAFGTPVTGRLALGAVLGVAGTAMLFGRDAASSSASLVGLGMTMGSMLLSVLGNIVAQRNHRAGIPTETGIAWGMTYGTLGVAAWVFAAGIPWRFESTPSYVLSLAYLAIVGSVVAFGTYFRLIEIVGAGPAAYVSVVCPVIAMLLSTGLEGYRWSGAAMFGVAMVLVGMVVALRAPRRPLPASAPVVRTGPAPAGESAAAGQGATDRR
jgi:drug/metabolite transporter (DMT)-like permease